MAFFQDSFQTDAVDTSPPTGWGSPSPTGNGVWAIKDQPPHYLRYSPVNNVAGQLTWTDVGNNRSFSFETKMTNAEAFAAGVATAGMQFNSTGGSHFRIFSLENGSMILNVYKDNVRITTTQLYAAGTFLPVTALYRLKVEYNGDVKLLLVKAWLDGETEPSFQDHSDKISIWTDNPDVGVRAFANPDSATSFVGIHSTEMTTYVSILGTVAAQSAVTGEAIMQWGMASTSAAQSTATGEASMQWSIEGSSAAQSNVTGALDLQLPLEGSSAAQSDVTGAAPQLEQNIEAAVTGQSALQSALDVIVAISGDIETVSDVSGSLFNERSINGDIAAVSFMIGTLDPISTILEGTITAMSNVQLLSLKSLMVTVSGVSNVQGNLDRFEILRMNAQINFETHLIAQKPYWG